MQNRILFSKFGEVEVDEVIDALEYSLDKVLQQEKIPADNEVQCGTAALHSLDLAKEHARNVLSKGISNKFYVD